MSVTEGNSGTKQVGFTVTLSRAADVPMAVNYATADQTATAGSDYLAVVFGTLIFNPGSLTRTINVTIYGDTLRELDETFAVNLSGATGGAVISDSQGIGTIVNDDRKNTAQRLRRADRPSPKPRPRRPRPPWLVSRGPQWTRRWATSTGTTPATA